VILNIDKSWTWLVSMRAKLTRRPQVTTDRPPVPLKPSKRSSPTQS
jgi:hypothetical protein